jgi:hypothetical protein
VSREGSLRVRSREHRILRPPERDEEGIALRVHDFAAVVREGLLQQALMLGEKVRVSVAELLEQLRGALDVGEEEGRCR